MVTTQRAGVVYKVRTGKACKNKWQTMNKEVTRFLSCDILATHTRRRSGATEVEFRQDALKYYHARHKGEFKFESAYDYLKDKPKWLRDISQHTKKDPKRKARTTPAKPTEKLRASDSENERVGSKPPGQKKARRLEKELVIITAGVAAKEAIISADIAKFAERARINMLSVRTEQSRQEVERERTELEREKQEDEIMQMDLTGMPEYKIRYFHQRIADILERQQIRKTQKAAALIADQAAKEAAALAEQVAREASTTEEQQAPRQTAYFDVSEGVDRVVLEDDDDTTALALLAAAPEFTEEDVLPLDSDESGATFKKQCEDMATAIDLEKGVEVIIAPWEEAGVDEVLIRTPEDSEDENE